MVSLSPKPSFLIVFVILSRIGLFQREELNPPPHPRSLRDSRSFKVNDEKVVRWIVVRLSLQRPDFDRRPAFVGFVVHKVAQSSHSISAFPCQYHCTSVPYSFIYPSPMPYNIGNRGVVK